MHVAGVPSWQMRIDRWNFQLDWALWFRAVESIPVPAAGLIPGPLTKAPPSEKNVAAATELAEGWKTWWLEAIGLSTSQIDQSFLPPDFNGLQAWPTFQELVISRWQEANDWHSARKRSGVDAFHPDRRNGKVIRDVEWDIGRNARPFDLDLVLIPVGDSTIRRVSDTRFLVPEHVYDGPAWTGWFYKKVRERA